MVRSSATEEKVMTWAVGGRWVPDSLEEGALAATRPHRQRSDAI